MHDITRLVSPRLWRGDSQSLTFAGSGAFHPVSKHDTGSNGYVMPEPALGRRWPHIESNRASRWGMESSKKACQQRAVSTQIQSVGNAAEGEPL